MLTRIMVSVTGISALMLIVLLFTTNPANGGPLVILGFFVFLYLTALGVLTFLFHFLSKVISRLLPRRQGIRTTEAMTFHRAYYYSSVVALVPIMFIAIQTVGEVGIYQVLLIFFFAVTAWIYVSNRTS